MTAMHVPAVFLAASGVSRQLSGTAGKILSFLSLPPRWHYGSGKPPSRDLVRTVLYFHSLVGDLGFRETDAFPGADGEILLRIYHGERCVGFLFELNGSVSLTVEDGDVEEFSKENATYVEAFSLAIEVAKKCNTYGSPAPSTLIEGKGGLLNSLSGKAPKTTPLQSLTNSVLPTTAAKSALISSNIIQLTSQEARRYSGPSTERPYRAAPA